MNLLSELPTRHMWLHMWLHLRSMRVDLLHPRTRSSIDDVLRRLVAEENSGWEDGVLSNGENFSSK